MGKPEIDREADIRKQHEEFSKENHDGHHRHSGLTTMQDLSTRRLRREWNMRMRQTVSTWNNGNGMSDNNAIHIQNN